MEVTHYWKGFGRTDIGHVRASNQDALSLDDTLGLWIVADGMGGHAGGDVASQLAVKAIHEYIAKNKRHKTHLEAEDLADLFQAAVNHANITIRHQGKNKPELKGMGTTVVFVFMPDSNATNAFIIHVGDSRAYLIRDQQISALTRDHTLLEERIQVGLLPRTAPTNHPLGHVLTRGVGVKSTVEADISKIELQATDEILLCSDGLNKMLQDDQILAILEENQTKPGQEKCQALIDEANRLGGKDNTTTLLIQAQEVSSKPL